MIAMLGMYDMPATRAANDRFWQAIRVRLGHGPDRLSRNRDVWEVWQSGDLLLAQTCGMPYRTRLAGKVNLIGTPDYGLPGCAPGHYRSVLVARADAPGDTPADFAQGTFAYNDPLSQSGWGAPMLHFAETGVRFNALLQTGSHAASALAVADGRAAMAAIDAQTWALWQDHGDVAAARLRVIGATAPTPGLPLITAASRDPAPIAAAIRAAIADLAASDRATLRLAGLVDIPGSAYLAVPDPPGHR